MHSTSPTRQAMTGRALAHGRLSAVERAFLGADIGAGRVPFTGWTDGQVAQLVGVSSAYVRAAKQVAANPQLRARVGVGGIGLLAAAKSMPRVIRPTRPNEPITSGITEADFIEMFGAVGKATRGACFQAFADEALAAVEAATTPTGNGVSTTADLFAHLHP